MRRPRRAGSGRRPVSAQHRSPASRPARAAASRLRAAPAGGQQQQHVVAAAVGADLAGEDLLVAVVVADRGQRRGLGAQRDRRQRLPVVAQLADQFGGEVLGLGGAAAVAGDQQPAAGGQRRGQLRAPAGQPPAAPPVRQQRGGQVRPGGRRRTDWSSAIRPPPGVGRRTATDLGVDLVQCRSAVPAPGVALPGPVHARQPAYANRRDPVVEQTAAAPRRARRGSRGGTRSPVTPVDHGVPQPADGGGDHRHAARHRLQRGQPERLVPGRGDQQVGRAVPAAGISSRGTAPTSRTRSATPHDSASARSRRACGSVVEPAGRAGRRPPRTRRRAPVRIARITVLEALALHQPADGEDPGPVRVPGRRPGRAGRTWSGSPRTGRRSSGTGARPSGPARRPRPGTAR